MNDLVENKPRRQPQLVDLWGFSLVLKNKTQKGASANRDFWSLK